jgi:hypothetical protein
MKKTSSKFAAGPMLIALALTLGGCGDKSPGSFGVSVEKNSTNSADQTSGITKEKKIDSSDKAAVSIKMPATVILADAANRLCSEAGIKPSYRKQFLATSDKTLFGKAPASITKNRQAVGAIMAISAAFEPAIGWPAGYDEAYMTRMTAVVNFANSLSTEVIGRVGKDALKDPQAAQQALITEIASLPPATLEGLWFQSLANAKAAGRPNPNMSGSNNPIEFKTGGSVVAIGPQGMLLNRSGTTIFGDGKVSGKSVELSLETSLSIGRDQKLSLDQKETSSESDAMKVDAGMKQ